jgi:hypothetical protein
MKQGHHAALRYRQLEGEDAESGRENMSRDLKHSQPVADQTLIQ